MVADVGFCSGIAWNTVTDGTTTDGNLQLWQAMHHEVTEVLMRVSGARTANAALIDALNYSAPGVINATLSGIRYPSKDNGLTSLYGGTKGFSQSFDPGDLEGSVESAFNVADAVSVRGYPPLAGDMLYMTIIGLTLTERGLILAGL